MVGKVMKKIHKLIYKFIIWYLKKYSNGVTKHPDRYYTWSWTFAFEDAIGIKNDEDIFSPPMSFQFVETGNKEVAKFEDWKNLVANTEQTEFGTVREEFEKMGISLPKEYEDIADRKVINKTLDIGSDPDVRKTVLEFEHEKNN